MKLGSLLCLVVLGFSLSFAQSEEKIEPQLGSIDYPRSESIRIGFKFGELTDTTSKIMKLPSSRVLMWLLRSDFADNRANAIPYENTSSSDPQSNFGNLVLNFFEKKDVIPQIVLFFEGRFGRPVEKIDVLKAKKQFSNYSVFVDKNSIFSERDIVPGGTFQSQQGLYLVENSVVRCRFLGLSEKNKNIEKIARDFMNTGKISKCPLELIKNDRIENIKPTSVIFSAVGNEYKYDSKKFKLVRTSYPSGKYDVNYANAESSSRFILEKISNLADKYKLNKYLLIRDIKDIDKMKTNFSSWNFITDEDDILWSNLGNATIFINKKSKISTSQIIFGAAPETASLERIESFFKETRR